MAKDLSETLKILEQSIDLRTEWGKEAWKTIQGYAGRGESAKLSLLKGLVMLFAGRGLDEILNVDPVDYQRNVSASCVCGNHLTKEVYKMRLKGRASKDGVEGQIHGRIKGKIPVSRMARDSRTEFLLGSVCYDNFPELLSDFGFHGFKETVKGARKQRKKDLEDVVAASPELSKKLRSYGIDPSQIEALAEFIKSNPDIREPSLLHELDPGKRNSFANWFAEGIAHGTIDHPDIVKTYQKLESAPHLLDVKSLAELTTYAYEFRKFETNAVIGGIKGDLLYLASLPDEDLLVSRFGRVNLGKHYVRPATRFRPREGLENVTVVEKLDQSHLSFIEALGIKLQFPEIEKIRREANREVAEKYGVGNSWHYLLKEVGAIFEEVKGELSEEYKAFGKIVGDHVLTKAEYLKAKDFLRRSRMGRGSDRDNYLRMFSIKDFREIAPAIASMGRKVKLAKKKLAQTGDEWLRRDVLKEEYALVEDLDRDFEKSMGLDRSLRDIARLIANAQFVENISFQKFQKDHGESMLDAYEEGLVARKFLKPAGKNHECSLKRWLDVIKKEDVRDLNVEEVRVLNELSAFMKYPLIEYTGELAKIDIRKLRTASKKGIDLIAQTHGLFKRFFEETGFDSSKAEGYHGLISKMKSIGMVMYIEESESSFLDPHFYCIDRLKKAFSGGISSYDFSALEEAVRNVEGAVEADEGLLKKINALNDENVLVLLGMRKSKGFFYQGEREVAEKTFVSKGLRESAERLCSEYEKALQLGPLEMSIRVRKNLWERREDWRNVSFAKSLGYAIYEKLMANDDSMWEVVNGVAGGYYLKDGRDKKGNKIFVRKPEYSLKSPDPDWRYFEFRRFMGDVESPIEWFNMASGQTETFRLHDNVWKNLEQDLKEGRIDQARYGAYGERLRQFEQKVNSYIQETYAFKTSDKGKLGETGKERSVYGSSRWGRWGRWR